MGFFSDKECECGCGNLLPLTIFNRGWKVLRGHKKLCAEVVTHATVSSIRQEPGARTKQGVNLGEGSIQTTRTFLRLKREGMEAEAIRIHNECIALVETLGTKTEAVMNLKRSVDRIIAAEAALESVTNPRRQNEKDSPVPINSGGTVLAIDGSRETEAASSPDPAPAAADSAGSSECDQQPGSDDPAAYQQREQLAAGTC